jgi:epoxyqueuosine reductase
MSLTSDIKAHARELGFDMVGVTRVAPPAHMAAFADWLDAGRYGEMNYLPARAAVRADPARLAPGAASLIALGVNYNPGPPPAAWDDPTHGRIARYAWAPDYHDAIKPQLYRLDAVIRAATGRETLGKACVDSAPLLERDFAMSAAVGFMGRNTCLITPGVGSWTLLAALLVPETLEYDELRPLAVPDETARADEPMPAGATWALQTGTGTCGRCFRCLAACPTRAFAGPHVLDARRCISYLTIELRGPIPRDLRPLMGNWIFGCDVCQEVCPYNRDAPAASSPLIAADANVAAPPLLDLLALDEAAFRARFRGSPILRTKRRGLVRNACVAAGNCPAWQEDAGGEPSVAVPALAALLHDEEPLVRGHAAWALGRLGGSAARATLKRAVEPEADRWVREELTLALA